MAQPPEGREGEVERERQAQAGEEGHWAVRGRWASPPAEGKGPREGQEWRSANGRRQLQTKAHRGAIPTPPPPRLSFSGRPRVCVSGGIPQ